MKPGRVYVKKIHGKKYLQLAWIDAETGKEKRRSSGVTRRREATQLALKVQAEISRGVTADPIAWSAFCDRYKDEKQASLKPKSRTDWETVRVSLTAFLAPKLLQDVTPEAISRWRRSLQDEGKPVDTLAKYLGSLARAMKWAVRMRLLPDAPYIDIPKKTRSTRGMKGRPVTDSEFADMLAAVPEALANKSTSVEEVDPRIVASWRETLWVFWYSGIRLDEVRLLAWEEGPLAIVGIDSARPMIRYSMDYEKGGRDRKIALTPDFVEHLRRTPPEQRRGLICKPLVTSRRPEDPPRVTTSETTIGRRISEIGEAAGVVVSRTADKVKYASAHDLRRSFGTRWAPRVFPAVLKELMRHDSIRTTEEFYVELHAEQTADAVWKDYEPGKGDPEGDPTDPVILKIRPA